MSKQQKILKIITFIGFAVLLLASLIKSIGGDDYFWHVKVGEWIIENKQIPKTGIFSWSAKDAQWFAHEWLAGIIMYLISIISLKYSPYIYLVIFMLILGFIIGYINRNRLVKNQIFTLIWVVFGIIIFINFSTARPHWITMSLMAIYVTILDKIKEKNYKYIWLIPIIAIFWVNVHGGSSNLLYLFPIGFLLTGIKNWNFGRLQSSKFDKKQILIYLSILLTSILCICINPRGLELLTYPYTYQDIEVSYITEWLPLHFGNMRIPFIILLTIFVLFIVTKKERIELSEIAMILLFILLSFMHLRFILWTYVIASLYIFKYIAPFEPKNEFSKENYSLFFIIFYSLSVFVIFFSLFFIKKEVQKPLSDEAIEVIKENPTERLYNDYNYGGYLIYNDIDAFIDGRADMYNLIEIYDDTMSQYSLGFDFKNEINEFLEKYNFDAILTSKYSAIYVTLKDLENIEILYEDDDIFYCHINK